MTGPDIDRLVETVREARDTLIEAYWTPDDVAEWDAALSDLAARARDSRQFCKEADADAKAAEADRDCLARRVAELEAALREIADLSTHDVTFAAGVEGSMRKMALRALAGDGGGA